MVPKKWLLFLLLVRACMRTCMCVTESDPTQCPWRPVHHGQAPVGCSHPVHGRNPAFTSQRQYVGHDGLVECQLAVWHLFFVNQPTDSLTNSFVLITPLLWVYFTLRQVISDVPDATLSVLLQQADLYVFLHSCWPRSIILVGVSLYSRVCDQGHGGSRLEAEVAELEESHTRAGEFLPIVVMAFVKQVKG